MTDDSSTESAHAAAPTPKAGDEVLFWPERKPFIQAALKAKVVGVSNVTPTTVQLLVSNHQTGRSFNVSVCEYSAGPAPGCWGLPKVATAE